MAADVARVRGEVDGTGHTADVDVARVDLDVDGETTRNLDPVAGVAAERHPSVTVAGEAQNAAGDGLGGLGPSRHPVRRAAHADTVGVGGDHLHVARVGRDDDLLYGVAD